MSLFRVFTPYLSELEYPNITDASDEYLEEVFSAENRHFLLRWLIERLNSKFIISPQWSQGNTERILADFLNNSGFCSNSEKYKFVTKDKTLSLEREIAIFEGIFNYMQDSSQKIEDRDDEQGLTSRDLQARLNREIDLFPKLKAVKLRGTAEKRKKIEQLEAEIEKLEKRTKNFAENNIEVALYEVSDNDFNNKMDKFTNQLINLQTVASQAKLLTGTSCTATSDRGISETNFERRLSDFDRESNRMLKYFQNVNWIQEVTTNNEENLKYSNDMKKMCQELAKDSTEIVEMNKTQQL